MSLNKFDTSVKSIIWSKPLLNEIIKIYEDCSEKGSDSEQGKVNLNKIVPELSTLFTRRQSLSFREKFANNLKSLLAEEKLTLTKLITILDPYYKLTVDLEKFNLIPTSKAGVKLVADQYCSYISKRGVDFNFMIIGRSGSGKSTLVNTLYKAMVSRSNHAVAVPEQPPNQTFSIKVVRNIVEEDGFRILLNIYDTPGYGDLIDNSGCFSVIVAKIKELYNAYLKKECEVDRDPTRIDERIHCCLYVIPPTGHRLSELDIKCLKELVGLVNIIPVIGRSDSLTTEEAEAFKIRIREDLIKNQIITFPELRYQFELPPGAVDNEFDEILSKIPLTVIGSNWEDKTKNQLLRKTPVGEINIEDPTVCDYSLLLKTLIHKHMFTLINTTDKVFYEKHRKQVMQHPV